jgi:hypothetical protein
MAARFQIWVMAFLDEGSEAMLRSFLIERYGISKRFVRINLHTTIYHSRRSLAGLSDGDEAVDITVASTELRMMSMAPGGENPRPDIDPLKHPVGIRIRRAAAAPLEVLRARFCEFETPKVLGARKPSDRRRSAFGARHYQPHISVLRTGAISDPNLSKIGARLREQIQSIRFDRLVIRCRTEA